jgi:hypothetical protein
MLINCKLSERTPDQVEAKYGRMRFGMVSQAAEGRAAMVGNLYPAYNASPAVGVVPEIVQRGQGGFGGDLPVPAVVGQHDRLGGAALVKAPGDGNGGAGKVGRSGLDVGHDEGVRQQPVRIRPVQMIVDSPSVFGRKTGSDDVGLTRGRLTRVSQLGHDGDHLIASGDWSGTGRLPGFPAVGMGRRGDSRCGCSYHRRCRRRSGDTVKRGSQHRSPCPLGSQQT